jgi:hypothetical protein
MQERGTMTRFQIGDEIIVTSPVKQEYEGKSGKIVAVDLIKFETGTIESYTVEFPDRTHQTFLGAALTLYSLSSKRKGTLS